MPEEIEPQPLPKNPTTVADLLPHLPVPYDYASQYACVFSEAFATRLEEVQQDAGQFRVSATPLTDGRYCIRGAILSEVPNGLYHSGFSQLDYSQFDQIDLLPWADAVALMPQPDPEPV